MQHLFDARWRTRALDGDPNAISALADAALLPLYRFAFHRVGRDHHLCEEVVQETLVRAIRDLGRYDPSRSEGRVLPWLMGLARNEVRRALRGRDGLEGSRLEAVWDRLDEELFRVYAGLETSALSDDHIQREETRELVNTTMSQLPAQYRDALEAKYVLGQSVRTIAGAFGSSEKTIESRLTRARSAFRATFMALTRAPNLKTI